MRPVLAACAAAFLTLTFLAFGFALPAGAQSPNGSNPGGSGWGPDRYGLKAGLASATVSMTRLENRVRRREGVAAMAFAEWTAASYVSLLTEVGCAQRGYTALVPVAGGRPPLERRPVRFDHLTVAALARVRYPGAAVEPYAVAGPRGDVFLGGKLDTTSARSTEWTAPPEDSTYSYKVQVIRPGDSDVQPEQKRFTVTVTTGDSAAARRLAWLERDERDSQPNTPHPADHEQETMDQVRDIAHPDALSDGS